MSYQTKYRDKWRQKAIESLGGKCEKCGSTEKLLILSFDPAIKSTPYFHRQVALHLEARSNARLWCRKCKSGVYSLEGNSRRSLREKVFKQLGGKCAVCADTNHLLVKPVDPLSTVFRSYWTNRSTLFRRILASPEICSQFILLCPACRELWKTSEVVYD